MKKISMLAATSSLLIIAAGFASAQDWDRAVSLFNQKQYRPAIREFHSVLKTYPEYWQAWYYIGASHFQLQGYQDSIDSFQHYIKGAQKDEKAQATGHYFIGLSHYQLKDYGKAIPALVNHISISERLRQKPEPVVRAALGRSYIFSEKFREAIPVLTAAASESRTDANNHYYLGFAHHKLNQDDRAMAALNQALAIDPKDADSLALLGNIHLNKARENPASIKQAVSAGERLLAVRDDHRAWSLLGQAYLLEKQYSKAAPLLDRFARANQDSAGAWFNLGIALSRSNQWKPAATALEHAVRLAPNHTGALLEMGYVYESDKQYDKALQAYQRAFEASGQRDETARASIDRVRQTITPPND